MQETELLFPPPEQRGSRAVRVGNGDGAEFTLTRRCHLSPDLAALHEQSIRLSYLPVGVNFKILTAPLRDADRLLIVGTAGAGSAESK